MGSKETEWKRSVLPIPTFRTINTIAELSMCVSGEPDVDLMYVDAELDTCLIRTVLEFAAWRNWNRGNSTVYVWYRAKPSFTDGRESKNNNNDEVYMSGVPVSASSFENNTNDAKETASLCVDIGDSKELLDENAAALIQTIKTIKASKQKTHAESFRILAEHPVQIVSHHADTYTLKQRWTIQNTGTEDWLWKDVDNEKNCCGEDETFVSVRFLPLNIPQQSVLSSSVPYHCGAKSTAHVHVVFHVDDRMLNDHAETTFYFQCARVRHDCDTDTNTITHSQRWFGPRFSARLRRQQLQRTLLVNRVLQQLAHFPHLQMSAVKKRAIAYDLVVAKGAKSALCKVEDIVCSIIDRCS